MKPLPSCKTFLAENTVYPDTRTLFQSVPHCLPQHMTDEILVAITTAGEKYPMTDQTPCQKTKREDVSIQNNYYVHKTNSLMKTY